MRSPINKEIHAEFRFFDLGKGHRSYAIPRLDSVAFSKRNYSLRWL